MFMKTGGRMTQCHSQLCDFEGGATRGSPPLPVLTITPPGMQATALSVLSLTSARHSSPAEPADFHFYIAQAPPI